MVVHLDLLTLINKSILLKMSISLVIVMRAALVSIVIDTSDYKFFPKIACNATE